MPKTTKRARIGKRKTKDEPRAIVFVGGEEARPSLAEYNEWNRYGSFQVKDEDDVKHTFSTGQYATILPDYVGANDNFPPRHEYWVAKIKDIKADPSNASVVYSMVRWCYSGRDVEEAVEKLHAKSFNASACGPYERFLSDQCDLVESHCFDEIVDLKTFQEFGMDQEPIPDESFYCRYTYDHLTGEIELREPLSATQPSSTSSDGTVAMSAAIPPTSASFASGSAPDPPFSLPPSVLRDSRTAALKKAKSKSKATQAIAATCLCKRPYTPLMKSDEDADTMRICPRPSCRVAFHTTCLEKAWVATPAALSTKRGMSASDRATARRLAYAASTADDDAPPAHTLLWASATGSAPTSGGAPTGRPLKRQRTGLNTPETSRSPSTGPSTVHAKAPVRLVDRIPTDLLSLAGQPIVRGGPFGVVGNVRLVTRARRMVHYLLQSTGDSRESDSAKDDAEQPESSSSTTHPPTDPGSEDEIEEVVAPSAAEASTSSKRAHAQDEIPKASHLESLQDDWVLGLGLVTPTELKLALRAAKAGAKEKAYMCPECGGVI